VFFALPNSFLAIILPTCQLQRLESILILVKVKVKVTLQLAAGQSVSLGEIFITVWQLRSCFCGVPSLTRGRVCLLYMLLALTRTVFLGSKFIGTHNHILLPQIWDFPFHHLLRLTGSQWRYSTLTPHMSTDFTVKSNSSCVWDPHYIASGEDPKKMPLPLLLCVDSLLQKCVYSTGV
jgi:hypothetical protein